jgi:hypothetical protein
VGACKQGRRQEDLVCGFEKQRERVAELFHNYQNALGVFGKGSESGSRQESIQPEKSPMTPAADSEPRVNEVP